MRKQKNILKMAIVVVGFIGLCSFMAVTWKNYSNKYFTMKYPDTYTITDEEMMEEGCSLFCEIKGDENTISMVQIIVADFEDEMDNSTRKSFLSNILLAQEDDLKDNEIYKNATCSKIKEAKKGKFSGYSLTFTAMVMDDPMQGEDFVAFSGNKLLCFFLQSDNATYMNQLNHIVSGIELK